MDAYQHIPRLDSADIEAALDRDSPEELSVAVLSAALYSRDPVWAQAICVRLSGHPDYNVRGNAILGFGHLARLHGTLDEHAVKPVIEAALHDAEDYVRGQAWAAAEDVEHFLKWKLHPQGGPPTKGST